MSACPHPEALRKAATDLRCPLCMEAEIERLQNFERGALQQIEDMEGEIERLRDEAAINETVTHGLRANRDDAEAEIEQLRAALERTQIGVNHIANYRTEKWPDYGTDPMAERWGNPRTPATGSTMERQMELIGVAVFLLSMLALFLVVYFDC